MAYNPRQPRNKDGEWTAGGSPYGPWTKYGSAKAKKAGQASEKAFKKATGLPPAMTDAEKKKLYGGKASKAKTVTFTKGFDSKGRVKHFKIIS